METLIGIITADGFVEVKDGRKFQIGKRGTDEEGYPEVVIDAESVGGDGWMYRQSIKPYIGMMCSFVTANGTHGYNFEVLPVDK